MPRTRPWTRTWTAAITLGCAALLVPPGPATADVPRAPSPRPLLASAAHPAAPLGAGPFRGGRRGAERVARYLELTAAQEAAIRGLLAQHRAAVEPRMTERRALHGRLRALLAGDDADAAAIGEVVLALAEQRRARAAARGELAARIDPVLVGEQKVKWRHLRELRAAAAPRPPR